MSRDDELDPLREAWRELDAPEPERALEQPDEAARAALEWMRGAWARVEPPPALVPGSLRRARRAPRWFALAAAAGIGALLLWAALEGAGGGSAPDPERGATVARAEVDAPVPVPAPEPSAAAEELSAALEQVEIAALSADRMELRSGPVRLILLTETTDLAEVRPRDG